MVNENKQEQDARFAAVYNADVTREQLAGVYARALAGACDAQGRSLEDVLEEYDSLLSDVFARLPQLETVLSSAMISADEKRKTIEKAFSGASELFLNFLRTLARRGRLDLLRDINRQAHLILDKAKGRVRVTITTAAPLDETVLAPLKEKLSTLVGGEPELSAVVDPETIGGIIVRVGDTVFDASIATQLNNVRQQMIDRSTHEIQSRRDRFRNTEGN
ncbi:MAG: ATP synthase F1 subunit delta [Planctomycetia bacterium]|nr:ATP synthase F1 subunit delta [Planctomycetia bacterium]